jgi:hypothetical protein
MVERHYALSTDDGDYALLERLGELNAKLENADGPVARRVATAARRRFLVDHARELRQIASNWLESSWILFDAVSKAEVGVDG